ncbi:hypothetical protein [Enterococcus rivorum]|uniref:hypothetical protein n=1 Tax=Enterococcus rivorum TaxID=762845 RepID=UPI003633174B
MARNRYIRISLIKQRPSINNRLFGNTMPVRRFSLFYHDFHQSMSKIEELLEELRNRKKVLWNKNAILLDSEGEVKKV